ncbi:MAG TPA: hypothetical protein VJQ54_03065 [Candidatus Sulfotelmatobacter sp.]|nr:hypothetical protein [Candidatus Sulfotelmatobacter sp.]
MPRQTAPVPESITELQTELQLFRSSHPLRTKLPESVWQSAAELARCHGIYVVARSLKLDYCTLKKHVSGSPESPSRGRKKPQAKFVELIGAARERVDEYLIEFESTRGRKLRIQCKSNTPPDWPALLRAWRRAER